MPEKIYNKLLISRYKHIRLSPYTYTKEGAYHMNNPFEKDRAVTASNPNPSGIDAIINVYITDNGLDLP